MTYSDAEEERGVGGMEMELLLWRYLYGFCLCYNYTFFGELPSGSDGPLGDGFILRLHPLSIISLTWDRHLSQASNQFLPVLCRGMWVKGIEAVSSVTGPITTGKVGGTGMVVLGLIERAQKWRADV